MMQEDMFYDKKYVARQHFRDELNLLQMLKDRHFQLKNVEASVYIQKMWRGYRMRSTVGVEIRAKRAAALRLTRFVRKRKQLKMFKNLAKDYKNFVAVVI